MFDASKYCISKLSDSFNVSSFFSGVGQIDDFLRKHAHVNQRFNIGQTWVLHVKNDTLVIGYYTISNASVSPSILPSVYTQNYPKYPIPCTLIGKLGVDKKSQNKGLGKFLLYDALRRIKSLSESIGCNAVIIDAIDERTANYYEKFGFTRFKDKPLSLFLPVASIPAK